MYLPLTQIKGDNSFAGSIQVRTAVDPKQAASELRRAVASVDPNLSLIQVQTVKDAVDGVLVFEELIGSLTGFSRRWRWCWRRLGCMA